MAEIPNISNRVNGQIGNNVNNFTEEVKEYIIILIICICVFILINLITCCVVIFNRKSIKKIENKTRGPQTWVI